MVPQQINHLEGLHHIALFYETEADRLQFLADYIRIGLDLNELCVIVSQQSADELLMELEKYGLTNALSMHHQSRIRIYDALETYTPGGSFETNFMLANVKQFIEDALSQGFSGLRTAGDMDWLEGHEHARADAGDYELKVNKLTDNSSHFTGLCLYPLKDASLTTIRNAALSHPNFVHDHSLFQNHYYIGNGADSALTLEALPSVSTADESRADDQTIRQLLASAAAT